MEAQQPQGLAAEVSEAELLTRASALRPCPAVLPASPPAPGRTATVWGQGKAAYDKVAGSKVQPGEEECHICRDDVPASVRLKPCAHSICLGCVEQLRAKNIFRYESRGPYALRAGTRAAAACLREREVSATCLPLRCRADKGIKCPFCRTYVDLYEPCNRFEGGPGALCARSTHPASPHAPHAPHHLYSPSPAHDTLRHTNRSCHGCHICAWDLQGGSRAQ